MCVVTVEENDVGLEAVDWTDMLWSVREVKKKWFRIDEGSENWCNWVSHNGQCISPILNSCVCASE